MRKHALPRPQPLKAGLTRAEMHAYYIAIVTSRKLVYERTALEGKA